MHEPEQTNFDQAMALVDLAVNDGGLIVDEDGLRPLDAEESLAALDGIREQKKLEELEGEGSQAQERIILGSVLHGDKDKTSAWTKFRNTLGLAPSAEVPDFMWSRPEHVRVAHEIDQAFLGRRDIRTINGKALIESFRLRSERGAVHGSLQGFSIDVKNLMAETEGFVENDFLIAIEILQSSKARGILASASQQLQHSLRSDRPVESVVTEMEGRLVQAREVVQGRIGSDHSFLEVSELGDKLIEVMTKEKEEAIPTGIDALDLDINGGVNPGRTGRLHCLGARLGVGKTTVAVAGAMGLSMNGGSVLFMSCELDEVEIGARAMAHYSGARGMPIPSWMLEGHGNRREVPENFHQLRKQWAEEQADGLVGRFRTKALFHCSAEDVREYVYAAKAKDPTLSAVFLDHFHALRPSKGISSRSQEMEARVLFLHQVAKECKLDLFLVAQLNRDATLAQRPTNSHINGTDAIGQLAHAIWLLEFPKREEGSKFDPTHLDLWHDKFRGGQRLRNKTMNVECSHLEIHRETCRIVGDTTVTLNPLF